MTLKQFYKNRPTPEYFRVIFGNEKEGKFIVVSNEAFVIATSAGIVDVDENAMVGDAWSKRIEAINLSNASFRFGRQAT